MQPAEYDYGTSRGMATDGEKRILEIQPEAIHERSPIYMGSPENVLKVMDFLVEYAEEGIEG